MAWKMDSWFHYDADTPCHTLHITGMEFLSSKNTQFILMHIILRICPCETSCSFQKIKVTMKDKYYESSQDIKASVTVQLKQP